MKEYPFQPFHPTTENVLLKRRPLTNSIHVSLGLHLPICLHDYSTLRSCYCFKNWRLKESLFAMLSAGPALYHISYRINK